MPLGPNFILDEFNRSLKSIFSQTLKANEIVIILDGLTKDKENIVKELTKQRNNINIYSIKKQKNLGDVLNFGLNKCKNDYIARVDADDINYDVRFERQINRIIESNYSIDILGSYYNLHYGKKLKIKKRKKNINFTYKYFNPVNHPTAIFNKRKILSIGGYPSIQRFEDYALWYKCIINGLKIQNIEESLVYTFVDSTYFSRRSGFNYCKMEINFQVYLLRNKYIDIFNFSFNCILRVFYALFGKFLKPLFVKI